MTVPTAAAEATAAPDTEPNRALASPETASFVGALRLFTCINSFTLLAIPFFVLAGELMNTGTAARRCR
jgi:TRAP-type mannitol/chloroaromatic compound transport system permease large subunit